MDKIEKINLEDGDDLGADDFLLLLVDKINEIIEVVNEIWEKD